MTQYINKNVLIAEIERRKQDAINNCGGFKSIREHECDSCIIEQYEEMKNIINTIEVKEVDLKLENENNNPKITAGTKIRSKVNPDVILRIISDDCHGDEFECSNGSVLSLNQIEKYYDIYIEEK